MDQDRRRYKVCFSPKPLANYSKVASNRSSAIYTPERTRYSFEELYDPAAADGYNEFVAGCSPGKSAHHQCKGGHEGCGEGDPVLRLHEDLPPHAAQGTHPQRPAPQLAGAADRALQQPGMAHRPERTLSPENSDSMKYLSNPSVVKGLFTALLLLASSVARPQSANPDTPSYTMRSGGTERSYKLHLPQGLPQGAPLVVVLHGYGANNDPGRSG